MDEEIEILQSIYLDDIVRVDLKSEKPNLEVLIYPLDDEEDTKKNLRLNLTFYFTKDVCVYLSFLNLLNCQSM